MLKKLPLFLVLALAALAMPLVTGGRGRPTALAADPTITEYPVPTADSYPGGIATGPDGALWFTEMGGNKIGRITVSGAITEYPIPTADSGPAGIAAGPDGALWFTERNSYKVGRITIGGAITEYLTGLGPADIAAGPDAALWFTEQNGNNIGRLVVSAKAEMISPPPGSTLPGNSVTFSWTAGNGVDGYALWVGSNPGSYETATDIADSGWLKSLSYTVHSVPTDGRTVYVELWSFINGGWQGNYYTYQATPPHKYVVFVGGIGGSLSSAQIDSLKGCSDPSNDPTFGYVKLTLVGMGYACGDFLQYSYTGGNVTDPGGGWQPNPYSCADTGYSLSPTINGSSTQVLHQMLSQFRSAHPEAVFVLVGHSQGGLIGFMELEGLQSNALSPSVPVESVITLDSPLGGVPLGGIWDRAVRLFYGRHVCPHDPGLYVDSPAVLEIAARVNVAASVHRQTVSWAQGLGASVVTLGNWDDCLYSLGHCLFPSDLFGETFPSTALTQIVENATLDGVPHGVDEMYDLCAQKVPDKCGFAFSHEGILHDKATEIAGFIGSQN